MNGGICLKGECSCAKGFSGERCEIDSSNPTSSSSTSTDSSVSKPPTRRRKNGINYLFHTTAAEVPPELLEAENEAIFNETSSAPQPPQEDTQTSAEEVFAPKNETTQENPVKNETAATNETESEPQIMNFHETIDEPGSSGHKKSGHGFFFYYFLFGFLSLLAAGILCAVGYYFFKDQIYGLLGKESDKGRHDDHDDKDKKDNKHRNFDDDDKEIKSPAHQKPDRHEDNKDDRFKDKSNYDS